MRYYVYSTHTNDILYTNWNPPSSEGDPTRTIESQVMINGGANRATPKLITPRGVRTEVTELQMEQLERCFVFQRDKKEGYILVMTSKEDPDDVSRAGMTAKDGSAPLTPDHPMFQRDDAPKPVKNNTVRETAA